MMGIFRGGGDTQSLPAAIEKKLFVLTGGKEYKKNLTGSHPLHLFELAYTRATSWNLHYFLH